MIKKDIVILGGGASALMCACSCNEKRQIIIIEKADRIGKKILATGNGRCNLTNLNLNNSFYNTLEVDKFFKRFDNKKTLNFFQDLGLETYSDQEGRVYPISNTANSVLDVLRLKIEKLKNTQILCNTTIDKITDKKDGFIIKLSNGELILTEKLVLAFGSNENNLLKDLPFKINSFKKSLVSLKTTPNKGLDGIRVDNVNISLKIRDKNFTENGEVLFKKNGISGIVVFNISSLLARENLDKIDIFLDFLPDISLNELISKLKKRIKTMQDYNTDNFLTGIFHKSINQNLIEKAKIPFKKNIEIVDNEILELANLIKKYHVKIVGFGDNNQVNSGGISLECLDDNLQSKYKKNLYCIGELVDVDGVCGGYNLQWAWTSGRIVGENL